MQTERVIRIARAMCRAARLDPDQPSHSLRDENRFPVPAAARDAPAWKLYVRQAEAFIAANEEAAARL